MKRVPLLAAVAGLSLTLLGSAPPASVRMTPDEASMLARFDDMLGVDVACAQLAVERGHSKDVRDFAGVLVREHAMAHQMIRDVAAQIKVTLKSYEDGSLHAEHDKTLKGLRERPDAAFDILFARHEVDYHKQVVDFINKQLIPAAKSPDLVAFLEQVGPAFDAHAKMADELWLRVAPKK